MAALPGVCQAVSTGDTVALDGSASNATAYHWAMTVLPSTSHAVLLNASTATPSFVADVDGTYVLTLVTDFGAANSLGVVATPP